VFTSLYARHLDGTGFGSLPQATTEAARKSVAAAYGIARRSGGGALVDDVTNSFMSGLHLACLIAAGVCWLGAVGALALPGRRRVAPTVEPVPVAATG
jgi:hypothetical protein